MKSILRKTLQIKQNKKTLEINFFLIFFPETPLSLAVNVKSKSSKMLIALVNGGAIVDFRNKTDGSTALHRTVAKSNIEALQTLLDLGMYNL